jgi:hypothetical protein
LACAQNFISGLLNRVPAAARNPGTKKLSIYMMEGYYKNLNLFGPSIEKEVMEN